jgi:hypothetical protein
MGQVRELNWWWAELDMHHVHAPSLRPSGLGQSIGTMMTFSVFSMLFPEFHDPWLMPLSNVAYRIPVKTSTGYNVHSSTEPTLPQSKRPPPSPRTQVQWHDICHCHCQVMLHHFSTGNGELHSLVFCEESKVVNTLKPRIFRLTALWRWITD